jgi:hypothetical protein
MPTVTAAVPVAVALEAVVPGGRTGVVSGVPVAGCAGLAPGAPTGVGWTAGAPVDFGATVVAFNGVFAGFGAVATAVGVGVDLLVFDAVLVITGLVVGAAVVVAGFGVVAAAVGVTAGLVVVVVAAVVGLTVVVAGLVVVAAVVGLTVVVAGVVVAGAAVPVVGADGAAAGVAVVAGPAESFFAAGAVFAATVVAGVALTTPGSRSTGVIPANAGDASHADQVRPASIRPEATSRVPARARFRCSGGLARIGCSFLLVARGHRRG